MSYNLFKAAMKKYCNHNSLELNETKLDEDLVEASTLVKKSNDIEQRITVEIVAEPFVPDAHNEYYSADTVAKGFESADKAWKDGRLNMNLFHQYDDVTKSNVELIKQYLVPFNCEVNGEVVKEGTWCAEVKWHNIQLWKQRTELLEDGTTAIAGLSLFGWGKREVIEEDNG